MTVFAIDPGYRQSALVVYDRHERRIIDHRIESNDDLLERLVITQAEAVVVEMLQGFGMPVGTEVMETIWWSGRFHEAALQACPRVERLSRKDVKAYLCGSTRATDSGIRVALIDRFGGTKADACGIKSKPGPLYGIKADEWSALAIAVTWSDRLADLAPWEYREAR